MWRCVKIAVREFSAGQNAQRRIVEAVTNGDVIVIEVDVPDAGTVGDIYGLHERFILCGGDHHRWRARDTEAIAELGKPVYHRASHGSTWGTATYAVQP